MPISIPRTPMPSVFAHPRPPASSGVPAASGRASPSTLDGPTASAHSFATREESMPPLIPRTNPFRPLSLRWCRRKLRITSTCPSWNFGRRTTAAHAWPVIKAWRTHALREADVSPTMNADEAVLRFVDEYSRMAEPYDASVVPRFAPFAAQPVAGGGGAPRGAGGGRGLGGGADEGGADGAPEPPVRDARFPEHRLPRGHVRRRPLLLRVACDRARAGPAGATPGPQGRGRVPFRRLGRPGSALRMGRVGRRGGGAPHPLALAAAPAAAGGEPARLERGRRRGGPRPGEADAEDDRRGGLLRAGGPAPRGRRLRPARRPHRP